MITAASLSTNRSNKRESNHSNRAKSSPPKRAPSNGNGLTFFSHAYSFTLPKKHSDAFSVEQQNALIAPVHACAGIWYNPSDFAHAGSVATRAPCIASRSKMPPDPLGFVHAQRARDGFSEYMHSIFSLKIAQPRVWAARRAERKELEAAARQKAAHEHTAGDFFLQSIRGRPVTVNTPDLCHVHDGRYRAEPRIKRQDVRGKDHGRVLSVLVVLLRVVPHAHDARPNHFKIKIQMHVSERMHAKNEKKRAF